MKRKRLTSRLIEKSKEALLLAVEIYNKPTVQYRLEAFAIFYTNAWELLMKAKIIEDTKTEKSIFLPKRRKTETQSAIDVLLKIKKKSIDADVLILLEKIGLTETRKLEREQKERSITFYEAISKTFSDETNPVRRNIVDIQDLRNSSAHLLVEEVEIIYSGLFQQGVLNYLKYLRLWFDEEIQITPRMLSLVFEFQPQNITSLRIRSKYSKDVQDFLQEKQSSVIQNIETYGNDYSIPIDTKLFLSKKPGKDAIDLSLSGKPTESGLTIISATKNPSETHPYFGKEVVKKIFELLPQKVIDTLPNKRLTIYDITAIRNSLKLPKNGGDEYIYIAKIGETSYFQYSTKFVEDIAKKLVHETLFLSNARENIKEKNKKSKK